MTEPDVNWSRDRRLVLWNRLWLAALALTSLVWGGSKFLENSQRQISAVKTSWGVDALRFTAIRDTAGELVGVRLGVPSAGQTATSLSWLEGCLTATH